VNTTTVCWFYDMHLPHTPVSAIEIFMAYFINPWLWVNRDKHVGSYVKMIQKWKWFIFLRQWGFWLHKRRKI